MTVPSVARLSAASATPVAQRAAKLQKHRDGLFCRTQQIKIKHPNNTCSDCGQSFAELGKLRAHVENKVCAKSKCDLCGYQCTSASQLEMHKNSSNCKKRQAEQQEKDSSVPANLMCQICVKTFADAKGYRRHKERNICKPPENLMCEVCKKTFSEKRSYLHHVESAKCKPPADNQSEAPSEEASASASEPLKKRGDISNRTCDLCGEVFSRPAKMQQHRGNKACKANQLRKQNTDPENTKCDLCGQIFGSVQNMEVHRDNDVCKYTRMKADFQNGIFSSVQDCFRCRNSHNPFENEGISGSIF